jgi:hypothetical protein
MSTVILVGMPEEKEILTGAFPTTLVLSGTDKLSLPKLVPPDCTRIVVSGLFGGLAPGIPVGGICAATTIVDRGEIVFVCDQVWNDAVVAAGKAAGLQFGCVPWYSSGIMDQADTASQRAYLHKKYGVGAIDDEARFAVALANARHIQCNDFRSCSDDYTETLPLAARGAIMNSDGSANISYLLHEIATEPAYQTLDLIKIGWDFGTSLHTLEYACNVVKGVFL